MNIVHLHEFSVLAQTCSYSEAAELLFISQSTLSKHIKNLELELGASLFDRTTQKVKISKYGRLLLPYAKQICGLHDEFFSALKKSLEADRDTLNIGTIPALAEYNITDVLLAFKMGRPQTTVNVTQGGLISEQLRQRKCELAFIRSIDNSDVDFTKIPFASDDMVVVLPAEHRLTKEKAISLEMLANEHFVLNEEHSNLYKLSISLCKRCGFEPKIIHTDHKNENLADFVIKGTCVALMMKRMALHVYSPKLVIADIYPRISTRVDLCYLKGVKLSEAARHFIRCAEVTREHYAPTESADF